MNLHSTIPVTFATILFLEISRTAISTCTAGIIVFAIALFAAKGDFARARGLDRVVALSSLCFAVPLAVFGAEHFAEAKSIMQLVPAFMPGRLFWTYLVGVALLAASLSIATKIQLRWSGLLYGIMMFLFVAMMDLPAALANPRDRISWVLLFRELSFGGGAWLLAAGAMDSRRVQPRAALVTVGRVLIGLAAVLYGVEHFFHPVNAPGVPLEKLMPEWIPARALIGYVTGAILLGSGFLILLARKTRTVAACLGAWILLLVLVVYGPILIAALLDASAAANLEGINYFFDTLLFAGTILALANASARAEVPRDSAGFTD
jgi:uncharacterized membrane protein